MKDKPYRQRFFADEELTTNHQIYTEFLTLTSDIRKELAFQGGLVITRMIIDHKIRHKSNKQELLQCEATGFLFRQWTIYKMIHQTTIDEFTENISNDEDNS
jgi:hypothetical protein